MTTSTTTHALSRLRSLLTRRTGAVVRRALLGLGATVALLGATPSAAIGLGFEAGGGAILAGAENPTVVGGGGEVAALLHIWDFDMGLLQLTPLLRVELGGLGGAAGQSTAAGGLGGAELLARLAFDIPIVDPFVELGVGAGLAYGASTQNAGDVKATVTGGGPLPMPSGYAGIGATIEVPFLPYLEARVGAHALSYELLGQTAPADVSPVMSRVSAHIGTGFRF